MISGRFTPYADIGASHATLNPTARGPIPPLGVLGSRTNHTTLTFFGKNDQTRSTVEVYFLKMQFKEAKFFMSWKKIVS